MSEARPLVSPLWWAIIGPREGYVTEVYPGEAVHYRRRIQRVFGVGRRLVGEYPTQAKAEAALAAAVAERDAAEDRLP